MAQGDKPVRQFSSGTVRASVWSDQGKSKDGQTFDVFRVRVDRRYKDPQTGWQSAKGFRPSDLADLELVASKAREFLLLKEREPGKE